MIGDDRVRFCHSCEKKVYNISAMPRGEARKLVAQNGNRICIRYVRLSNGKVVTTDTKLYKITGRASRLATGVFGATLTLSALATAQTEMPAAKTEAPKIEVKQDKDYSKTSRISFTIEDPNGAVIPNAKVVMTGEKTGEVFTGFSDDEGVAQFEFIPHGLYKTEVSFAGFRTRNLTFEITQAVEPNVKIGLDVGEIMGMIVDVSYEIPLFAAIAAGDNDTVKNMISSGFDVNTKAQNSKTTALHVAVEHGNLEIVKLLLSNGADVNAKDNEKRTPLTRISDAFEDDNKILLEILRLLISKGADVNFRDEEDGFTILMGAAEEDNVEVVKLLLEAGADPNSKDEDGETAFDKTDSDEIKQLLIRYGARKTEN
jgi:hypothetical protein